MTVSMRNERKTHLQRWVILLISPAVWTVSFGLVYLLDEAVCGLHFWTQFVWGEFTAVIPVMLLIILFTLAVTASNAYFGWKIWHRARTAARDENSAQRDRFIGAAGLMLGILFSFLTLGLAVVVIWLQPC